VCGKDKIEDAGKLPAALGGHQQRRPDPDEHAIFHHLVKAPIVPGLALRHIPVKVVVANRN
jgi:hypothetical protein